MFMGQFRPTTHKFGLDLWLQLHFERHIILGHPVFFYSYYIYFLGHGYTSSLITTLHNVYFVKYDDTVSFYDTVSDTIRRRGGYRAIVTEEGVDTATFFGEITDLEFDNH